MLNWSRWVACFAPLCISVAVSAQPCERRWELPAEGGVLAVEQRAPNILALELQPHGERSPDSEMLLPRNSDTLCLPERGKPLRIGPLTVPLDAASPRSLTVINGAATGLAAALSFDSAQAVELRFPADVPLFGVISSRHRPLAFDRDATVFAGLNGDAGGPLLWTTRGWGVLWDGKGGVVRRGDGRAEILQWGNHHFALYLLGGTPKEILGAATQLTGRSQLPAKWMLGFQNFEWGQNEAELLRHDAEYHARGIPVSAYGLDYDWFRYGEDGGGDVSWDSERFPNGASGELARDLAKRGAHLWLIRKPWLTIGTQLWRTAYKRGWMYVKGDGTPSKTFDFNTVEARHWWWAQHQPLLGSGVGGFWNDEAERDNFSFLQMARAEYEGARASTEKRLWSTNRNFYLGAQRFAYQSWSGDQKSSWGALAQQPTMMLGSAHLAQSWWGMDVGGFKGLPWWADVPNGFRGSPEPELYARWMQLGAFVPVYRAHGRFNLHRQPWLFGTRAEAAAREAIALRYSLLPYWYALADAAAQDGVPPVRSSALEYPDDREAERLSDQFFVGPDLLFAPVLHKGAGQVKVHLPAGIWSDWFTGKRYQGPLDLDRTVDTGTWRDFPLFVRAGAIIPTTAALPPESDRPWETLALELYPEAVESVRSIYDDDGESYQYERGQFFRVPFRQRLTDGGAEVSIEAVQGVFVSPLHRLRLRFHLPVQPGSSQGGFAVHVAGEPITGVREEAEGDYRIVEAEVPFAPGERIEVRPAHIPAHIPEAQTQ